MNCVLCGSPTASIQDKACDDCAKQHFVNELVNDITDIEICTHTTVEQREKMADDLIRKGWRKS